MPIAQRVATVGDGTEGGPLPVISVINDATMEPGLQQVSLVEVVHEDPPAERTQLLAIEGVPKTPTRHTSPLREDISPLLNPRRPAALEAVPQASGRLPHEAALRAQVTITGGAPLVVHVKHWGNILVANLS